MCLVNATTPYTSKHLSFIWLVTFIADIPLGNGQVVSKLFVQVLRSHDVASILSWQKFVKYTSRGNQASRVKLK
jgi:hypothetical protein